MLQVPWLRLAAEKQDLPQRGQDHHLRLTMQALVLLQKKHPSEPKQTAWA